MVHTLCVFIIPRAVTESMVVKRKFYIDSFVKRSKIVVTFIPERIFPVTAFGGGGAGCIQGQTILCARIHEQDSLSLIIPEVQLVTVLLFAVAALRIVSPDYGHMGC
jgi:hypothetical protein